MLQGKINEKDLEISKLKAQLEENIEDQNLRKQLEEEKKNY